MIIYYLYKLLFWKKKITRVNWLIPSGQSGLFQGLPASFIWSFFTWKMSAEQFRNYLQHMSNSQHFEPLNFPGPQGPSEIPPNHMKPPILNSLSRHFFVDFPKPPPSGSLKARVHSPDSILAISWKMELDLIAPIWDPKIIYRIIWLWAGEGMDISFGERILKVTAPHVHPWSSNILIPKACVCTNLSHPKYQCFCWYVCVQFQHETHLTSG